MVLFGCFKPFDKAVEQMAFWTSPKCRCLCWIEAIYDITDSFNCSYSDRNAGCTLCQAGTDNFSLEGRGVEKEKLQRKRLRKITRKTTQLKVFTAETLISHASAFQDLTKNIWSGGPLNWFSRSEFWKHPLDAKGIPGVLDMTMERCHTSRDDLIHLPVLYHTSVKLINAPALILA